jgi:hypothetical protein
MRGTTSVHTHAHRCPARPCYPSVVNVHATQRVCHVPPSHIPPPPTHPPTNSQLELRGVDLAGNVALPVQSLWWVQPPSSPPPHHHLVERVARCPLPCCGSTAHPARRRALFTCVRVRVRVPIAASTAVASSPVHLYLGMWTRQPLRPPPCSASLLGRPLQKPPPPSPLHSRTTTRQGRRSSDTP